MLQTLYFVAHGGQQLGPFTIAEISVKIQRYELSLSDYVFSDLEADWFMIVAYPAFSDLIQFAKPQQPPKPEMASATQDIPEWFILRGQNRFGPYSYIDIVKLLQRRSLFEYDYTWNPSLATWQLIASLEEFKAEKIKSLKESSHLELSNVFFRRRHARANYGASLIIHNNLKVWKGKSFEISPGGAGLEIESGELQIGLVIRVHFKPGDEAPPFTVKGEVVGLRTHSDDQVKRVAYGVKFLELSQQTQDYLAQYTEKNVRAS